MKSQNILWIAITRKKMLDKKSLFIFVFCGGNKLPHVILTSNWTSIASSMVHSVPAGPLRITLDLDGKCKETFLKKKPY